MNESITEKPEANENISISDLLAIVERNRQGILRRIGLKGADREGIMRELEEIPDDVLQSRLPELETILENEIQFNVATGNPTGNPVAANTELMANTHELIDVIKARLEKAS